MATHQIDFAVIGGGPAGVAAAAAAASRGGTVVLLERTARLGGSVTAAMHRSLCGLYATAPRSPVDTLNAGTQRDVIAHMQLLAPDAVLPKQIGKTWVLEFPAAVYEKALLNCCARPNIQLLTDTRLMGLRRQGGRVTAIQADSQWLEVKAVIDCTGSGALLQMIGEEVMHPPDEQRMLGGYSMHLTGLIGDAEMLRLQVPYALAKAVDSGVLPREARFAMFHPGPGGSEGICKLAVDPSQFADANIRSLAERIIEHLKQELPGLAAVRIAETSPSALPRDGRRLKGKATVTEDDVLSGVQIGESAVHAWWPIEHWDPDKGPTYAYPPVGRHYDIPADAMQSDLVENLFAAGTCVSATASAAASLRASGICLATGHAAGIAACDVIDRIARS